MDKIKYYKILSNADKLVEDLQLGGCFIQGDTSSKYVYMRNPKDISKIISFAPSVYDNMMEYDSDFSEEFENCITSNADLSFKITEELKKGNYVDMTYETRNIIFAVPYNIEELENLTFLTLTNHSFICANHKQRNLSTLHFTNNNEGLGEVNSHIHPSNEVMRKIFEDINTSVKLAPIKEEIADHYVLYKYGDIVQEDSFKL